MNSGRTFRPPFVDLVNLADHYRLPPIDWARIEGRLDHGLTQAPQSGGPDGTPAG